MKGYDVDFNWEIKRNLWGASFFCPPSFLFSNDNIMGKYGILNGVCQENDEI